MISDSWLNLCFCFGFYVWVNCITMNVLHVLKYLERYQEKTENKHTQLTSCDVLHKKALSAVKSIWGKACLAVAPDRWSLVTCRINTKNHVTEIKFSFAFYCNYRWLFKYRFLLIVLTATDTNSQENQCTRGGH